MRISLDWLKQYVEIDIPTPELAARLTMVGLEVEDVEELGRKYEHFVVGQVLEVQKHPKADRLSVCKVDTGTETLQIVCGAPNVAQGQKVAVGLSGATIPRNQHDPGGAPFVLSHVKLRGVDSHGMICSAYELDKGDDRDGILVFNDDAPVGKPLAEYFGLNDTVLTVGITPNRPDALSHIGIAREVAALLGKPLRLPVVKVPEAPQPVLGAISITVDDTAGCPRYTARVIRGTKAVPSPAWLQARLNAVGVRPINSIVDVTNYVLMECGHPLHAFDYEKISGKKLVIRKARAGEKFTTLDHKGRTLRNETVMICDAAGPVAVAGIMGGENSEISDSTTTVLLESAYFQPGSIRRASKYLGISTEASQRFERGADPSITTWAADRAASLICELGGGEVLAGIVDVYPDKILKRLVDVRTQRTSEILGVSLTPQIISQLLGRIGIETAVKTGSDSVTCSVPTWRPDIEREVDLVEEVARLHGYDNIPTQTRVVMQMGDHAPIEEFSSAIRRVLVGAGFREVVANSMQEESLAQLATGAYVRLANPLSKDMAALRSDLIPGMLEIVRNNIFHGEKNLRLFEIGKVYRRGSEPGVQSYVEDFIEEERILMVLSGLAKPRSWDTPERTADLFDLKGELESLFNTIFLDKIKYIPYPTTKALTENGLSIEITGEYAGFLATVRRDICVKYDIEQDVCVAECSLGILDRNRRREQRFKPLPKYPRVMRDLAIVLDESTTVGDLTATINEAGKPLLRSVELFDVYTGDQLPKGQKSCAFALEFLSEEQTLAAGEVDKVMQKIIGAVSGRHQASIRQ
jgi:phenylalanyl-tRNA synthetase beta chain